ncbi:MAG: ACT domain-containing protein [Syntrophomonas sp.]
MAKRDKKFYMVSEDILPESILNTAVAKEMLAKGEADNIMEAVDKVGMARSTYYKYKDGVYSFFNAENLNIINISMMLKNVSGVLSGVLNCVASLEGNVLTINQNLPIHGVAYVTLSISVEEMTVTIDNLLKALKELTGVITVEIIGKS